jgi:heme A synthase
MSGQPTTTPSASPTSDDARPRPGARAWTITTAVLGWAIFLQAITAGRILSGDDWARDAHNIWANVLFLAALVAGIVAAFRLHGRPHGRRMAVMLLALAAALFLQMGLGIQAAEGEDTLWIHVPLGVGIMAFAAQPMHLARRLG